MVTSSAFHGYIIQHATSHFLALPVRERLCSFHSVAHFEESSPGITLNCCIWGCGLWCLHKSMASGEASLLFVFEILSKILRPNSCQFSSNPRLELWSLISPPFNRNDTMRRSSLLLSWFQSIQGALWWCLWGFSGRQAVPQDFLVRGNNLHCSALWTPLKY